MPDYTSRSYHSVKNLTLYFCHLSQTSLMGNGRRIMFAFRDSLIWIWEKSKGRQFIYGLEI